MAKLLDKQRYKCALGAMQTVQAITRAIPVLHSGPGCAQKLSDGTGSSGYFSPNIFPCTSINEKDVVFGGASIEPRRIQVYGQILTDRGRAAVRIRMNDEVMVLETDGEGRFEAEIHLGSGGNYIMVDYEDFSGTVRLNSIRLPLDWDGKDALAFNR